MTTDPNHLTNEGTPTMDTTTETPDQLRARAAALSAASAESFDRCDTDGFLSQWALDLSAQKLRREATIREDGGVSEFPALFTLDGEFVPAKVIDTQYGRRWMLLNATGRATGEFLPYLPVRRSTLARKGYTEGYVVRPAKADIVGRGRGLSGTAWVATVATDDPWTAPLSIVTTDRFTDDVAR